MVWAACPVGYFDTLLVPEVLQKGRRAKGCEDGKRPTVYRVAV